MFIIRDCNKNIVGKESGYATMSAALSVANNRRTKAYKALQSSYENSEKTCYNPNNRVVYSITWTK